MTPEKQFENKIKAYLKSKGAWFFKVWGGGFQCSGIPDLIVCSPNGKFVAIEVKSEHGSPTPLQVYNIEKINECKGFGVILKPSGFEEFKKMFEENYL